MVFAARASVIMKLLEKLSNEKLLKMPGDCFLVPCEADILLLPAFNNLIHLEVRLQSCYWGFESSDSVSIGSRIHEHGDAFEDNERQFEEEDGETYEDDQEEGDKQYPDREFEKYEEEEVEEEECEE
ncbi:hypothetical protein MKX01_018815 [Papaver californicum]|nr:hypothetical protein MKX01_018815 [Papaver californicum]